MSSYKYNSTISESIFLRISCALNWWILRMFAASSVEKDLGLLWGAYKLSLPNMSHIENFRIYASIYVWKTGALQSPSHLTKACNLCGGFKMVGGWLLVFGWDSKVVYLFAQSKKGVGPRILDESPKCNAFRPKETAWGWLHRAASPSTLFGGWITCKFFRAHNTLYEVQNSTNFLFRNVWLKRVFALFIPTFL